MSFFEMLIPTALGLTLVAGLIIALVVYKKNPHGTTNRIFGLLTLLTSAWLIVVFLSLQPQLIEYSLILIRLSIALGALQVLLFFLLSHTLPNTPLQLSSWATLSVTLLALLVVTVNMSPYAFTGIEIIEGAPQPIPGPGLLPFLLFSVCLSSYTVYGLYQKLRRSTGIRKQQFRYIMLGIGLMLGMIVGTVLIPVVFFQQSALVPLSPVYVMLFLLLTAYAIIRYRLMDIRAIVLRAVTFSLLVSTFFVVYGFPIYILSKLLVRYELSEVGHAVLGVLMVAIAIPTYHYYRLILQKITDRFFYQNKIDYRRALVSLGEELSGTIQIDDVTSTITKSMSEVVRSKKTIIMLQDPNKDVFEPRASHGAKSFKATIPDDHILIKHLEHLHGPLIKDELEILQRKSHDTHSNLEITQITQTLIWLDVAVIVPLFVNRKLTGLILLGDKLSGEPYLQDDVNFFAALAPQAATALENARLYQESLEFGKRLEHEVEQATHDLEAANEQLRQLDKAKSEFLSIASHQLYTPLTALRGYLSMMKEGDYGDIPDQQEPVLEMLEKSVDRLVDLVKNLLDISRIESGRLELKLEDVDLAAMTNEVVSDLLPNAVNKNLELHFEKPHEELPRVVADEQRLRQVLLNFIDNAIKYTQKGNIVVRLAQESDELVFSVTDTGRGLAKEDMSRLFNKFSRVEGAARSHTEGTGLGLYVAKQIVSEHRGHVEAKSPGKGMGSTFIMRLPIAGSPKSLVAGQEASVVIKAT